MYNDDNLPEEPQPTELPTSTPSDPIEEARKARRAKEILESVTPEENPLEKPSTADIIMDVAGELDKLEEYAEEHHMQTEVEIAKQEILHKDEEAVAENRPADAADWKADSKSRFEEREAHKQQLVEDQRAYQQEMLAKRAAHEAEMAQKRAELDAERRAKEAEHKTQMEKGRAELDAQRRAEQERLRREREAMDAKLKGERDDESDDND